MNKLSTNQINKLKKKTVLIAITVAIILFVLKLVFSVVTDSISLLASTIDSALDLVSSLSIFIAIRYSLKPADKYHSYGYGKVEALAGFFQSLLILTSSAYVIYAAIMRVQSPKPIQNIAQGIIVMIIATLLTLFLVIVQSRTLKKTNSLALESDRLHYLSDLLSNITIILAFIIQKFFNYIWFDVIAGSIIALVIAKSSYSILKNSLDVLLDRDISRLYTNTLKVFINANKKTIKGYHDFRARSAGGTSFLEIHLDIDKDISFDESHDIAEELTDYFKKKHNELDVIIHTDPV